MKRLFLVVFLTACAGAEPKPALWSECANANPAACMQWGDSQKKANTPTSSSVVAYQYACHLGEAAGCLEVSKFFGRIRENQDEMSRALSEACDKGEKKACVQIAESWPRRRAIPVFEEACAAGVGEGCAAHARLLRNMWRLESQLAEATMLDVRACEMGVMQSCLRAGQAYLYGTGVVASVPTAELYFARSCNENVGDGCEVLAQIYGVGLGIAADPQRAKTYYEWGVKHTPPELEEYQRSGFVINVSSCSVGDGIGCFNAGLTLVEGVEVDRNLTTAREFFQLACKSGVHSGCERAESIRQSTRVKTTGSR